MYDLETLADQWLAAKEAEAKAQSERRQIEDRMKSLIGVPDDLDGTETASPDGYKIRITGRINRKINSEKLQELAAEAGLSDHLSSLFRWKPEINMSVWKKADASITTPLLGAITSEPGRASFSIVKGDE